MCPRAARIVVGVHEVTGQAEVPVDVYDEQITRIKHHIRFLGDLDNDAKRLKARVIAPADGEALATKLKAVKYLECSAKTGQGVELLFSDVVEAGWAKAAKRQDWAPGIPAKKPASACGHPKCLKPVAREGYCLHHYMDFQMGLLPAVDALPQAVRQPKKKQQQEEEAESEPEQDSAVMYKHQLTLFCQRYAPENLPKVWPSLNFNICFQR